MILLCALVLPTEKCTVCMKILVYFKFLGVYCTDGWHAKNKIKNHTFALNTL